MSTWQLQMEAVHRDAYIYSDDDEGETTEVSPRCGLHPGMPKRRAYPRGEVSRFRSPCTPVECTDEQKETDMTGVERDEGVWKEAEAVGSANDCVFHANGQSVEGSICFRLDACFLTQQIPDGQVGPEDLATDDSRQVHVDGGIESDQVRWFAYLTRHDGRRVRRGPPEGKSLSEFCQYW